jgi:hypothetical protein
MRDYYINFSRKKFCNILRRSARTNEESGDDGSEPRNLSQPETEVTGNQREETTSGIPAAQQDPVQMLLNFFLL